MKEYVISLLSAALVAALIGVLAPTGEGGGLSRHLRLLTSLFLITVIILPLGDAMGTIEGFLDGSVTLPEIGGSTEEDYRKELDEALASSSKAYFATLLIEKLEEEFTIPEGEVRCAIRWSEDAGEARPERISVILSGSAIWKDPASIEAFVRDLVGCECVTAIE